MTYPNKPGSARHSATSSAAAESVTASAGTMRDWVLKEIAKRGKRGATCEEIEDKLALRHQTVSARLRELAIFERVEVIGTRQTRSGRQARVYVIKSARSNHP